MGIYQEMGIAEGFGDSMRPGNNWTALTETFANRSGEEYDRDSVRVLAGFVTSALVDELGSPSSNEPLFRLIADRFADGAQPPLGQTSRAEFDDTVRQTVRRMVWHDEHIRSGNGVTK